MNRSLTFFLYNNATNLIDLYTYINKFRKRYSERYQYQTVNMDDTDLLRFVDDEFKDITIVGIVKGHAVKHFLIHYIEDRLELQCNKEVWTEFNGVMEQLVEHMKAAFKMKYNSSVGAEQKVEAEQKEINFYKYIYDALRREEPYLDLIDLIGQKKDDVYLPITNNSDSKHKIRFNNSVFYAYYSAYKYLYSNLFSGDKRKYPFEMY